MHERHYHITKLNGHISLGMREGAFDPFGPTLPSFDRRRGLRTVRYRVVGVFDTYEAACDAVREIEYANSLPQSTFKMSVIP